MKIIAVTSRSPHDITDGYTLRANHILNSLAKVQGADITLVSPILNNESKSSQNWARSTNIKLCPVSVSESVEWIRENRILFKANTKRTIDDLLANDSYNGIYVIGLQPIIDLSDMSFGVPLVGDLIDETSPHMIASIRQNLVGLQWADCTRAVRNYIYYKKIAVKSFNSYAGIVVTAHDDANRLSNCYDSKRIHIVPNGVRSSLKDRERNTCPCKSIVFHGVYSYPPNEEAANFLIRYVAPRLGRLCPEYRLRIIGRNPTSAMRKAAASRNNVLIEGEVKDMNLSLQQATIGAYPIFSRTGIQNKILEAWSNFLPVVTTVEALNVFCQFAPSARDCAITAKTAEEFAQAIVSLIDDKYKCEEFISKAKRLVRSHFDWDSSAKKIIGLYS